MPKICWAVILSSVCAHPLKAAETGYGVGLSLAHDTNIARVETNPQSEWTEVAIFGLFYRQETVDLNAHMLAQVERRRFLHNTFTGDTGGFLDGAAVWMILPRRVSWAFQDTFREVQLNLTTPATPSNLAKSNTLSTGPDFTFPLSSTNSAVVGGRYGRFDIQNSNLDNRRYTGFVRGVHALSSQAKLSLNYEATRTYFEPGAQVFPTVLREDWYGGYENLSPINTTSIEVGTSRVSQSGSPQCQPAPCSVSQQSQERGRLVLASTSEALSSQSKVRFALTDQISDTFTDLLAGVTSSTAPREVGVVVFNGTNLATGDVYHSERGEIAYASNDGRFAYTVQGYRRLVDFETLDQDYQESGGTAYWTWTYSGDLRFNVSAIYIRRSIPSIDRQDIDRTYGVNGTYGVNAKFTVTVGVTRAQRQSSAPLSSYVDNQVLLILGYSSGFTDVRSRR